MNPNFEPDDEKEFRKPIDWPWWGLMIGLFLGTVATIIWHLM